jgi:hypothetical protein
MRDGTYFPSLIGVERARAEDQNWAVGTFTWATSKLRGIEAAVAKRPLNLRLWKAADDTTAAITEKLLEWEPPEPPN